MKLAVFGATGGTGPFVLREAVLRGHEVTAFARRPEALVVPSSLASIVTGDARNLDDAAAAVQGQDAVIMTVSGRTQPGAVCEIARAVTTAMSEAGVPRLIATSAYGIVATKPYVMAGLVRRMFAATFADQAAADELVQATELQWTIARATRLIDKPAKRPARTTTELISKGPYSLSRDAWAETLLDLAESGTDIRRIVNVTG
ncbi:MAG TPA: NAD(P)H-binding protein [Acidothermaceae bacterium]|jgi:putative NADH-flavin reductase